MSRDTNDQKDPKQIIEEALRYIERQLERVVTDPRYFPITPVSNIRKELSTIKEELKWLK